MHPTGTDLIWFRVKQLAMEYANRRRTPAGASVERDVRRIVGNVVGSDRIEREALAFYCREARDLADQYRAARLGARESQRISATAGR